MQQTSALKSYPALNIIAAAVSLLCCTGGGLLGGIVGVNMQ